VAAVNVVEAREEIVEISLDAAALKVSAALYGGGGGFGPIAMDKTEQVLDGGLEDESNDEEFDEEDVMDE
jgi:hypothetical protein